MSAVGVSRDEQLAAAVSQDGESLYVSLRRVGGRAARARC